VALIFPAYGVCRALNLLHANILFTNSQTCSWDVRTKKVSYESVPTINDVAAVTNYGPTATLFTMGRNYTVQQYDLNPSGTATMVASVQHPPANTPPSPPNSLNESTMQSMDTPMTTAMEVPKSAPQILMDSESSEGDGFSAMSPLQKIAQEMDQVQEEQERRDRVGPLSPVSSRGSQSSRSTGSSGRAPRYRYDKPSSTARSSKSSGGGGTVFSSGNSSFQGSSFKGTSRESISIRSTSSTASSSRYGSSALRKEVLRSPDESHKTKNMDLFPFTKARLSDVPYRNSQLGPNRSPDDLRQNMLRVVFGWDNDIEELIRDECKFVYLQNSSIILTSIVARHPAGSAAAVLLTKWLGDLGADLMASMVGSESMTSSDWMLLALSGMGQESQKKVGEAFCQRLLEKGDIHPAVAILLGLGEHNDAIEVYVSRKYFMEAILLTCLMFPTDWQRQSFLVRKWGELAVQSGKAELAVKCFSCMGLESSEPWFSPRAQDAVFSAQKEHLLGALSPPLSPPSASSGRVMAKMSSLKLVTDFGKGPLPQRMIPEDDEQTPMNIGVTPIAESAMSPTGGRNWIPSSARTARREGSREPSSARTATPGAYRRKRLPSRSDADRSTNNENLASLVVPNRGQRGDPIPMTAVDNVGREDETLPFSRRASSTGGQRPDLVLSAATYKPSVSKEHMPSPAAGVFDNLSQPESSGSSRSRKPQDLNLEMMDTIIVHGPDTGYSSNISPPLTGASGASLRSAKARGIDQFISSLDEANFYNRQRSDPKPEPIRPGSRNESRPESRTARASSRGRDQSEGRGRSGVRYIRPAKRSPSSPVPMSPEDAGIYANSSQEAATNTESFDDERYYKQEVTSPIATESITSARTHRSRARTGASKPRSSSKVARRSDSPEPPARARSRATSRASSRRPADDRGRSANRGDASARRSPGSPQPMFLEEEYQPVRPRQRSSSRRAGERATSTRREPSPDRRVPRDRSMSRKGASALRESSRSRVNIREPSPERMLERAPESRPASRQSNISGRSGHLSRPITVTRRELAAKELEDRRLSLARRPSAPMIPHPGDLAYRPIQFERSYTDNSDYGMSAYRDPIQRSHTADPEISKKYSPTNRIPMGTTSTTSVPIGLPATPRAMRHPRYMSTDPNEREGIPAVPMIPDNLAQYAEEPQEVSQDALGPLLPSTTFGQTHAPSRSASAPPEDLSPLNMAPRLSPTTSQYAPIRRGSLGGRGHSRMNTSPDFPPPNYKRISPPPITASIDETIHESQVVILQQDDAPGPPPLLAELQHLAIPPPPPPPPMFTPSHSRKGSLGVINIAIDEHPSEAAQESISPVVGPMTTSPNMHRRGRGSVSENLGMTFKRVTERMRSTSRHKSPPLQTNISPYESVPQFTYRPGAYARSPIEGNNNDSYFGNMSPPPPPPVQPAEQIISPIDDGRNPNFSGYKHPKEVRANLPPEQLQRGVYQSQEQLAQEAYQTPMI
jgi:hypothetical protein